MARILVALLTALLLTACATDGGQSPQRADDRPLPRNYDEVIAGTSDCGELQEIFDTAANTADAQAGTDAGRDYRRVMDAADERMDEVGCYD